MFPAFSQDWNLRNVHQLSANGFSRLTEVPWILRPGDPSSARRRHGRITVVVGPRLRLQQLRVSVQALTGELEAQWNQAEQLLTWVRPSAPDAEGHREALLNRHDLEDGVCTAVTALPFTDSPSFDVHFMFQRFFTTLPCSEQDLEQVSFSLCGSIMQRRFFW